MKLFSLRCLSRASKQKSHPLEVLFSNQFLLEQEGSKVAAIIDSKSTETLHCLTQTGMACSTSTTVLAILYSNRLDLRSILWWRPSIWGKIPLVKAIERKARAKSRNRHASIEINSNPASPMLTWKWLFLLTSEASNINNCVQLRNHHHPSHNLPAFDIRLKKSWTRLIPHLSDTTPKTSCIGLYLCRSPN